MVLRVGERELIARFEPDDAPSVGERVTLAVDMSSRPCIFDRAYRAAYLSAQPMRRHLSRRIDEEPESMTIAELTPRPGSFATYLESQGSRCAG